jgi:phosphate transport system substrate-binding protein
MEKNKRVINILLIVIVILVVVGCVLGFVYFTKEKTKPIIDPEEKKAIQNQEKLFSLETYPRIDGSTVTLPLAEAFKADFTGTDIKDVDVTHSKTHNAYVNLINGDTDLILVTYPSDDEQKKKVLN